MQKILLGVIGNMGPETDELFQARVRVASESPTDQDAVPMIVIKNNNIPDRTEAILNDGQNPVKELTASAKKIEACEAQFAVLPCNTAHYFREDTQKNTDVVLLDMLEATAQSIGKSNPSAIIGLLATNGTVETGIYDQYLEKAGFGESIKPEGDDQENLVHAAIYGSLTGEGNKREPIGIKAGQKENPAKLLGQSVQKLVDRGADTVILGCTELPIVQGALEEQFPIVKFVDPMEEVAKQAVEIAREAEARASDDMSYNQSIELVKDVAAEVTGKRPKNKSDLAVDRAIGDRLKQR